MAAAYTGAADPISARTDERLVAQIKSGDEAAFREIYDRYFGRIYRFARRRFPNRADTEETVQEIFVNVFRSIHTYRARATFLGWVYGVARKTIANEFRKRQRAASVIRSDDEPLNAVPTSWMARRTFSPLEEYECRERVWRLGDTAHNELTPEQWLLFSLHHLRHRPIKEIARVQGMTSDAVKSHLYRARRTLFPR
jgi:RNA polymerase sigma-70 factor (ECF subfamily)